MDDDIIQLTASIAPGEPARIVGRHFSGMAKYAAGVERSVLVFGESSS